MSRSTWARSYTNLDWPRGTPFFPKRSCAASEYARTGEHIRNGTPWYLQLRQQSSTAPLLLLGIEASAHVSPNPKCLHDSELPPFSSPSKVFQIPEQTANKWKTKPNFHLFTVHSSYYEEPPPQNIIYAQTIGSHMLGNLKNKNFIQGALQPEGSTLSSG